jgi:hypothetical protein
MVLRARGFRASSKACAVAADVQLLSGSVAGELRLVLCGACRRVLSE